MGVYGRADAEGAPRAVQRDGAGAMRPLRAVVQVYGRADAEGAPRAVQRDGAGALRSLRAIFQNALGPLGEVLDGGVSGAGDPFNGEHAGRGRGWGCGGSWGGGRRGRAGAAAAGAEAGRVR